jgi:hypothetical protein
MPAPRTTVAGESPNAKLRQTYGVCWRQIPVGKPWKWSDWVDYLFSTFLPSSDSIIIHDDRSLDFLFLARVLKGLSSISRVGCDPIHLVSNSIRIQLSIIISYVDCTILSYRNVARSRCSAQVRSQGELELILLFVANARTLVDAYPASLSIELVLINGSAIARSVGKDGEGISRWKSMGPDGVNGGERG